MNTRILTSVAAVAVISAIAAVACGQKVQKGHDVAAVHPAPQAQAACPPGMVLANHGSECVANHPHSYKLHICEALAQKDRATKGGDANARRGMLKLHCEQKPDEYCPSHKCVL